MRTFFGVGRLQSITFDPSASLAIMVYILYNAARSLALLSATSLHSLKFETASNM
jgi:hypothetical protein